MHTFWCLKSYAPVFLILVADVAIHFRFIYYESNFSDFDGVFRLCLVHEFYEFGYYSTFVFIW